MAAEHTLFADELIHAVELLAEVFAAKSIRYAIVGGLATVLRGRPRFTQDADVLLDVPQVSLPSLLDELRQRGFDFDTTKVIQEYVREHMTVVQYRSIRVDWLKPVIPLYSHALRDAEKLPWTEGRLVRVAKPEGIILTKMLAFRPQDQADIDTLLAANSDTIDLDYIRREWSSVSAGEDERNAWLEAAIARNVPPRQ